MHQQWAAIAKHIKGGAETGHAKNLGNVMKHLPGEMCVRKTSRCRESVLTVCRHTPIEDQASQHSCAARVLTS